jgi:inner membrane protein involved in colicin E2 resistance
MFSKVFRAGRRPGLKFLLLLIVLALLYPPIWYVNFLLGARASHADAQLSAISNELGGIDQVLSGPWLAIPYDAVVERRREGDLTQDIERRLAVFAPRSLEVEGQADSRRLRRGVFERVGFTAQLQFDAEFAWPDIEAVDPAVDTVFWDRAVVVLATNTGRGIGTIGPLSASNLPEPASFDSSAPFSINGPHWRESSQTPIFGARDGGQVDFFDARRTGWGRQANVRLGEGAQAAAPLTGGELTIAVSFPLGVQGSGTLAISPIGETSRVALDAAGEPVRAATAYRPARTRADGTTSFEWEVAGFARSIPEHRWIGMGGGFSVSAEPLGVIFPARIADYGKLRGGLTFVPVFVSLFVAALFAIEARTARQFHMVQYLTLGSSFALFVVGLTALAEFWPFTPSFIVGALTIGGIVVAYVARAHSPRVALRYLAPTLAALFIGLYALYELPDYALSIGVAITVIGFAAMALSTARTAWYGEAPAETE